MIFPQIENGQASWLDQDAMGATPAHYAAAQGTERSNINIIPPTVH